MGGGLLIPRGHVYFPNMMLKPPQNFDSRPSPTHFEERILEPRQINATVMITQAINGPLDQHFISTGAKCPCALIILLQCRGRYTNETTL